MLSIKLKKLLFTIKTIKKLSHGSFSPLLEYSVAKNITKGKLNKRNYCFESDLRRTQKISQVKISLLSQCNEPKISKTNTNMTSCAS